MNEYALICDPGKRRDSAAIMVMKNTVTIIPRHALLKNQDRTRNFYDIVFLDKSIRKPYPQLTRDLSRLMRSTELSNNCDLLLEINNTGEAVQDMLREDGLAPICILVTAGVEVQEVHADFGQVFKAPGGSKLNRLQVVKEIHVPKEDIVTAGMAAQQQKRVRCPSTLPWKEELEKQLNHFKGTERKRGRSYEADEIEVHDDFVTCFNIGCWWFTRERKDTIIPEKAIGRERVADRGWDPMDYI